MSYKQTGTRHSYQPKRTATMQASAIAPASHEAFRQEWDTNFDLALQKARELQKKGFLVEECLQKGALMESKAKKLTEDLKQRGYEVELIPVAKWADENVVFLIYKPTRKTATPQPQTIRTVKPLTPEDIINAFVKNFTYQYPSGPESPNPAYFRQSGHMPDPKLVAALVDPDHPSKDAIIEKIRQTRNEPPTYRFENTPKFRGAINRLVAKNKYAEYIVFDNKIPKGVHIQYLKKALRSIGDGPIRVYVLPGRFDPIYLLREDPPRYAILLSPYIEPPPSQTIKVSDVEAVAPSVGVS